MYNLRTRKLSNIVHIKSNTNCRKFKVPRKTNNFEPEPIVYSEIQKESARLAMGLYQCAPAQPFEEFNEDDIES